jgi:TolB protein
MKISKKFLRFVAFFSLALCYSFQAFAFLSFSVKNEDVPKTKILFFGFDSADPQFKSDVSDILGGIRKNLKTTDLFEILKQSGQIEMAMPKPVEIGISNKGIGEFGNINTLLPAAENLTVESLPNFEKYSKAGIGAIVIGQFDRDAAGNLEVRVRMWDVLDQRQLFGKFYSASRDNFRKMSNIISGEIFKAITGEKVSHFDSQILYVSETGSANKRIKKISIIDFDGKNRRVLTDGNDLVLTPIFSRKPDEIFYLRYFEKRQPQIFSLDLNNLRTKKIGGFPGTTFAASAHPKDRNIILLSAIIDGNSDIYEMNIASNTAKRLTKSPAIETTASYSPDAKYIAFSSDRDDGQQIYVMDSRGDSVKRISNGGGSYSKPIWSPDGTLIAFTKIKGNQFSVGVMAPSGKGEKILAKGYLVEGAKWSPNGRYLIYSKKRGDYGKESVPRLFIVDIITGFEFEMPTPQNEGATDPDWA